MGAIAVSADAATTGLSVLLVEDNEIDVEITKQVFTKAGAPVSLQVARDGKEALDVLYAGKPERSPQLILLDLRLPGIDGREVLRRIKNDADLCVIPVAVLTGQDDENGMMEIVKLGGNMYFVKPMTERDAAMLFPAVSKYWLVLEKLLKRTRERETGDEPAAD